MANRTNLKKHQAKFYFFLKFGAAGTAVRIAIYIASKYVDTIPTSHLHPLLHILIWWTVVAIVVPFVPLPEQQKCPKP